jgi:RimJ/RimL family protein N-acetyltransferase
MDRPQYRTLLPLFDELRGECVIVRPWRTEDAPLLFEAIMESLDHIRPWLPWTDSYHSVEDVQNWVIQCQAHWLLRENMNLSYWEQGSGRFLGGIGLHPLDWEIGHFEIGYWIRASATGHGYVTEAAHLLTEFAFNSLQANRVAIRCDERNKRSAAVAHRLGFVYEGCRRCDLKATDGTLRNTLVFSMIRADRQK